MANIRERQEFILGPKVDFFNSYLQKITLDNYVTFPEGAACGIIINCVNACGHGTLALKVSGSGRTNELTVETTLRSNAPLIPSAGNNITFGELDENE